MQGNGESKLCVKESKLCSWNCCWCLLCEGPAEVPVAPRSCFQQGCECKRARARSGKPAMGLCSAPSAWALLPGRHWPQLSPACPSSWLGHGQVNLPSQALGQQRFAILLLWSIPLPRRRNQVLALPISAGRCEVLLHLLPMFGSPSSTGPSFLERYIDCWDDKWGK